tara:strand:- start:2 stop:463 length:462 start_codon:yes stop_codon:yes gene_type:complete
MKLTKQALKRIIKEELEATLNEALPGLQRDTNIRGEKYKKGDESFQALKRSVNYGDQNYGQFVTGVISADFDTSNPSYSYSLKNEATGETYTGGEQGSQFEVTQMHNTLRHGPDGKFDPRGLEILSKIIGVEVNQLRNSLQAGKVKLDLQYMD